MIRDAACLSRRHMLGATALAVATPALDRDTEFSHENAAGCNSKYVIGGNTDRIVEGHRSPEVSLF